MTSEQPCSDAAILNQWHPLGAFEEMPVGVVQQTTLLGEPVSFARTDDEQPLVWRTTPALPAGDPIKRESIPDPLPVMTEYFYLWTSLGSPPKQLFEINEFHDPDRRNLHLGTIGVSCSAPRAIENFLDMGHFPFVHTNTLGAEPHTAVAEYEVNIDPDTDDILATECMFYRPSEGQMGAYAYRVPHPYCVLIYVIYPSRLEVIGLFCQSVTADYIKANLILNMVDEESSKSANRRFQQAVFAQDKIILENQYPKRLPLDPRAETPIRADKSAIAYRRWLSERGITYGVIPAG